MRCSKREHTVNSRSPITSLRLIILTLLSLLFLLTYTAGLFLGVLFLPLRYGILLLVACVVRRERTAVVQPPAAGATGQAGAGETEEEAGTRPAVPAATNWCGWCWRTGRLYPVRRNDRTDLLEALDILDGQPEARAWSLLTDHVWTTEELLSYRVSPLYWEECPILEKLFLVGPRFITETEGHYQSLALFAF